MTQFARTGAPARSPLRRGLMFVLSSPSGAGKTTMSRALMAEDSGITMSVSATTRSPRPGEVDGVDYYFVSHDQFQSMVEENALLEWATVFGNRYGTPRAPVESALADGRDVLFDIDWQGTQQLQQTDAASDLVRVFILPPHLDELERRLKNRNTDHPEVIADRMARALTFAFGEAPAASVKSTCRSFWPSAGTTDATPSSTDAPAPLLKQALCRRGVFGLL